MITENIATNRFSNLFRHMPSDLCFSCCFCLKPAPPVPTQDFEEPSEQANETADCTLIQLLLLPPADRKRLILLKRAVLLRVWSPDSALLKKESLAMMGQRAQRQSALFYEFDLDEAVPQDHLLRAIDRFADLAEGLVGGEAFGINASLIKADANREDGIEPKNWSPQEHAIRVTSEYLDTLDDAAFGAATPVQPKYLSPVDPAARWSAADRGKAHFLYSTNYLVDLDNAVIVDVETTATIRQAENRAARDMIERGDGPLWSLPGAPRR